ncbi:MAG: hypothetical protein IPL14_16165 [Nitrospira sp.]|nr:hypothetical protein [Nitrospira sp.]
MKPRRSFRGHDRTGDGGVSSDLAAQAGMIDHHVFSEAPGQMEERGHAVAMLQVHVRLNLEHEAGERFVGQL